MSLPTVSRMRELFSLDHATGVLRWQVERRCGRGVQRVRMAAGSVAGSAKAHGYRQVCVDGAMLYEHRIIYAIVHGEWPAGEVDHIDGDRSNNRPENLRLASRCENSWNQGVRSDNTSGVSGVWFDKARGKFAAQIRTSGKRRSLGRFDTLDEAVSARRSAEANERGEFIRQ